MNWLTKKICGFADMQFADQSKEICELAYLRNLRLQIEPKNLRIKKKQLQICHQCQRYPWPTATSINNTGCKFATSIKGCSLSREYFREFWKKFETALMGYSGAWGKLILEKNLMLKISWHCPFKLPFACTKLYKVKTADSRCHSLPSEAV